MNASTTYTQLLTWLFRSVVCFATAATANSASGAIQISFTTIDVPGASATHLFGINNDGVMVGVYRDGVSAEWVPFKLSGSNIEMVTGLDDWPRGIGDNGQVIGGSMSSLLGSGPGFPSRSAMDISNDGTITGFYGASEKQGFSWKDGTFTTIDVPGASFTRPMGINNQNEIVGWTSDETNSGGSRSFIATDSGFSFLALPGARDTYAGGINDAGMVVGWSGLGVSWLWDGSQFTTFRVPEAIPSGSTEAYAINDSGQIVGSFNTGSTEHGFLAQISFVDDPPGGEVPEPTSLVAWLVLCVSGAATVRRRPRRSS
jgi:uncharacterized membrane protein